MLRQNPHQALLFVVAPQRKCDKNPVCTLISRTVSEHLVSSFLPRNYEEKSLEKSDVSSHSALSNLRSSLQL